MLIMMWIHMMQKDVKLFYLFFFSYKKKWSRNWYLLVHSATHQMQLNWKYFIPVRHGNSFCKQKGARTLIHLQYRYTQYRIVHYCSLIGTAPPPPPPPSLLLLLLLVKQFSFHLSVRSYVYVLWNGNEGEMCSIEYCVYFGEASAIFCVITQVPW